MKTADMLDESEAIRISSTCFHMDVRYVWYVWYCFRHEDSNLLCFPQIAGGDASQQGEVSLCLLNCGCTDMGAGHRDGANYQLEKEQRLSSTISLPNFGTSLIANVVKHRRYGRYRRWRVKQIEVNFHLQSSRAMSTAGMRSWEHWRSRPGVPRVRPIRRFGDTCYEMCQVLSQVSFFSKVCGFNWFHVWRRVFFSRFRWVFSCCWSETALGFRTVSSQAPKALMSTPRNHMKWRKPWTNRWNMDGENMWKFSPVVQVETDSWLAFFILFPDQKMIKAIQIVRMRANQSPSLKLWNFFLVIAKASMAQVQFCFGRPTVKFWKFQAVLSLAEENGFKFQVILRF